MSTTNNTLAKLHGNLARALDDYHEKAGKSPERTVRAANDKVRAAREAISDHITSGAQACGDCGGKPLGIVQSAAAGALGKIEIYEVGCTTCPDHRALGTTPEAAVAKWNAKEFLPSKK